MHSQRIYLLSAWREPAPSREEGLCRVVLEEPRTGRHWGFSDPYQLAAFLEGQSREMEDEHPPLNPDSHPRGE
jgi:hypothetical protein